MQKENNREQPNVVSASIQTPEVANENDNMDEKELNKGSLLGKFRNAKSLADAYANLQAEFTRKSQKLSEYEKSDNLLKNLKTSKIKAVNNTLAQNSQNLNSVANNKSKNAILSDKKGEQASDKGDNFIKVDGVKSVLKQSESDLQLGENEKTSAEKQSENEVEAKNKNNSELKSNSFNAESDEDLENQNSKNTNNKPHTWQQQVDDFLTKHPDAKVFANNIVEEIYNDSELSNNNKSLEIAYSRVLAKKYKPENELVKDEVFLNNYIYNNKNITQKIVLDYLNSLKNSNAPPMIVSSKGTHLGAGVFNKPQNLNEAKIIVERMLKKQ